VSVDYRSLVGLRAPTTFIVEGSRPIKEAVNVSQFPIFLSPSAQKTSGETFSLDEK
jgi:hypothetical protein